MATWIWVACLFAALTIGYIAGFACGSVKSESETSAAPTENAYIREAEINASAYKEIEVRKAELEAQNDLEKFRIMTEKDENGKE